MPRQLSFIEPRLATLVDQPPLRSGWIYEVIEFAAEGFTHIECHCPRCRMTRFRPISWLPHVSMGLAIARLSERLRCAECRAVNCNPSSRGDLEDVLGKPLGRRG